MPEIKLDARSGLERLAVAGRIGSAEGEAGVTLALRGGVAIASVIARQGASEALAERVRNAFGLELPISPRRHVALPFAFAWAGPGQWLAMAENFDGHAFERRLRDELRGLAAVCDQSDGRTILRVGGARTRDALAKGVMLDLHPSAFGPGDVGVTAVAHIGMHFWQLDDAPTYDFVVFRSLAADFWRWVVDAGAEFGVTIENA